MVFTPKYRREVFTGEILHRCEDIMIEVCDSFGAMLVEFNGEHDHVHLLEHYPPKVALSTLVNSLKGVSARLPRKEFPVHIRRYLWGGHFWSPSYLAASCGGAPLSIMLVCRKRGTLDADFEADIASAREATDNEMRDTWPGV